MLRAVIFDLFGTLVDSFSTREHLAVLRQMAERAGVDEEKFIALWNATTNERALGRFETLPEHIIELCQALGNEVSLETAQACAAFRVALTQRCLTPRPDACSTLSALRARGMRVGLLSDFSVEGPGIWRKTAMAPLVHFAVFSCDVKMKKPNPEIYHCVCRGLSVTPADCLYVGDGGSQELSGAAAVGMRPIRIAAPHANHTDPHVIDPDSWDGPVIKSLSDVLRLLE